MNVKTPIIIKEILGKNIYNKFEEYRKLLPKPKNKIVIFTSKDGKELLEKAMLKIKL